MGVVISLAERRAARGLPAAPAVSPVAPPAAPVAAATFWFDLRDPASYFAAERVERALPGVEWRPALLPDPPNLDAAALEERARALHLPLVWPDGHARGEPARVSRAMRVAHFAAEIGRAEAFALAAARLTWCGGFDVEDPEVLVDAVAAAQLPFEAAMSAAGDLDRDDALAEAGRRLIAEGADRLPAFALATGLRCGEDRLAEVAAAARAGTAAAG